MKEGKWRSIGMVAQACPKRVSTRGQYAATFACLKAFNSFPAFCCSKTVSLSSSSFNSRFRSEREIIMHA